MHSSNKKKKKKKKKKKSQRRLPLHEKNLLRVGAIVGSEMFSQVRSLAADRVSPPVSKRQTTTWPPAAGSAWKSCFDQLGYDRSAVIIQRCAACPWISAIFPGGRHYFSPHKMAKKNHWLSWHSRFNALQINSYVFSEECKWKKIRSVDESWHLRSANSASITSPSHWPSSGDVWVRAYNVWLRQGPSYSMNVVVHIGKQRLYKPRDCHQILTSSRTVRQRQNDNLRFCLPCEKCEWWGRRERAPVNFLKESFADEETCRDWYRIEHAGRWLDQRVAILADQPFCSDEVDDQLSSLLCQLIH